MMHAKFIQGSVPLLSSQWYLGMQLDYRNILLKMLSNVHAHSHMTYNVLRYATVWWVLSKQYYAVL